VGCFPLKRVLPVDSAEGSRVLGAARKVVFGAPAPNTCRLGAPTPKNAWVEGKPSGDLHVA
jgi:hypothetical protein